MLSPPKGWQAVGLIEPPLRTDILVWNGKSRSIARFTRGKFLAYADGVAMCDPYDEAWLIKGVTHWAPLPDAPK